jgi:hypothetical protein
MSKIALTGNASGTGTLTIAAPNTNSDRTLDLPDGAGTVAVSPLSASLDMNGNELILDVDGDTSITADTDDRIDFKLGGTDSVHFVPTAAHGNGIGIGTSAPLRQLHINNTSAMVCLIYFLVMV